MNRPFACALILAGAGLLALPATAQKPVGDVFASDATIHGAVVLAAGGGTRVMSGSSVTAGEGTASMRLTRGGELRICPYTSVSLSTPASGRDLMVGMGVGGVETHYSLGHNADSILTPDFRLLLAGPGAFHLAITADARGNTCVRTLPGNTASVIVTEQLGDGVYQVRPQDQVYFHNGGVSTAEAVAPPNCGCPAPVPVQQAQTAPPAPPPPAPAQTQTSPPQSAPAATALPLPPAVLAAAAPKKNDVTAPPPPINPGELHVQVEAPFVYRAMEPPIPEAPVVARMRLQQMPAVLRAGTTVQPPPAPPPPELQAPQPVAAAKPPKKKGFFGRIGSFFAAVFH